LFVSNCNQQSQLAPITIQRPKHDENKNCAVNSGLALPEDDHSDSVEDLFRGCSQAKIATSR
jgi:hypothetical protein